MPIAMQTAALRFVIGFPDLVNCRVLPRGGPSSCSLKQRSGTRYAKIPCPEVCHASRSDDSSHSKRGCTKMIHPSPHASVCKDRRDPSFRQDLRIATNVLARQLG